MTIAVLPPNWDAQLVSALSAPLNAVNLAFFNNVFVTERGGTPRSAQLGETGGTNEGGANNIIDTTLGSAASGVSFPGASNYNSTGVQSYATWNEGLSANVDTLQESQYSTFLSDLRSGSVSLAQLEEDYNNTPAAGAGNATFPSIGAAFPTVGGQDVSATALIGKANAQPTNATLTGFWSNVGNLFMPTNPGGIIPTPGSVASGAENIAGKTGTVASSGIIDSIKGVAMSSLGVRALILFVGIALLLMALKELTSDNGPVSTVTAPIVLAGNSAKGKAKDGAEAAALS